MIFEYDTSFPGRIVVIETTGKYRWGIALQLTWFCNPNQHKAFRWWHAEAMLANQNGIEAPTEPDRLNLEDSIMPGFLTVTIDDRLLQPLPDPVKVVVCSERILEHVLEGGCNDGDMDMVQVWYHENYQAYIDALTRWRER